MAASREDAVAVASTAQRLGVDPRSLWALIELESGGNPNVWGGSGGQYRGLIQFGPGARKEVALPNRPMSIAEQMPYVEKYFQQRGFKPGEHGVKELYRTVLVGNPFQSGTDSFGTNSDSAAKRMMPGGDLYGRFSEKLAPLLGGGLSVGAAPVARSDSAEPVSPRPDPLSAVALSMVEAGTNLRSNPLLSSDRMAMDALPGIRAQQAAIAALLSEARPLPVETATNAIARGLSAPQAAAPGGGFVARTGNSGISTGDHLDARWADGRPITEEDLDRYLRIGDKAPSDWPVTSGYGPRRAPAPGASSFHKGVDLGIPSGTPIYATGDAKLKQSLGEQGGAGYMVTVATPEGDLNLLHLTPGSSPLSRR